MPSSWKAVEIGWNDLATHYNIRTAGRTRQPKQPAQLVRTDVQMNQCTFIFFWMSMDPD